MWKRVIVRAPVGECLLACFASVPVQLTLYLSGWSAASQSTSLKVNKLMLAFMLTGCSSLKIVRRKCSQCPPAGMSISALLNLDVTKLNVILWLAAAAITLAKRPGSHLTDVTCLDTYMLDSHVAMWPVTCRCHHLVYCRGLPILWRDQ